MMKEKWEIWSKLEGSFQGKATEKVQAKPSQAVSVYAVIGSVKSNARKVYTEVGPIASIGIYSQVSV